MTADDTPRNDTPVLACDLTRMQAGDLAACAHYVRVGLGSGAAVLWVPEGSDETFARAVFDFYSVAVDIIQLQAPKEYRADAPALRLAGFGLKVMERAWSRSIERLYAPTAGAPAYFAIQDRLPVTLIAGTGGLVEQLEARAFPETSDDLVFLELEDHAARKASEVVATDSLVADSYRATTQAAVTTPDPALQGSAFEPRSGAVLIAPTANLTDEALLVSVLSAAAELGPVDVLVADTVLAASGQCGSLVRALQVRGVSALSERFADIDQVMARSRDTNRSILSLRDMRALDPMGAWSASFGAPVIAGIGFDLTTPPALPAKVRTAISHPNKMAGLIADTAIDTQWPRAAAVSPAREPSSANPISSLSVVIATHARPAMLGEALQSIAEQDTLPDEVIVVDDGSPDDLAADNVKLCDDFVACPLRYQRTENLYPGHARNTGVALSASDWIYFLDDDNRLTPEALSKVKSVQLADPGVEAVFSFMMGFGADAPKGVIPFLGPIGSASLFENHAADTGFAISKAAFERIGGFPETYGVGKEDYAMALKIARSGMAWHLIPEPLYAYRIHEDRIRKTHRVRAANSFLPLSSVLPVTDSQGRLNRDGLLERLSFIQAERLALRHVPERASERLSPWSVFIHHGLRPFLRGSAALRGAATGEGPLGRLIRSIFFQRRR